MFSVNAMDCMKSKGDLLLRRFSHHLVGPHKFESKVSLLTDMLDTKNARENTPPLDAATKVKGSKQARPSAMQAEKKMFKMIFTIISMFDCRWVSNARFCQVFAVGTQLLSSRCNVVPQRHMCCHSIATICIQPMVNLSNSTMPIVHCSYSEF